MKTLTTRDQTGVPPVRDVEGMNGRPGGEVSSQHLPGEAEALLILGEARGSMAV